MWRFILTLLFVIECSGQYEHFHEEKPVWGVSPTKVKIKLAQERAPEALTAGNAEEISNQIENSRLKCKDYQDITYEEINVGGLMASFQNVQRLKQPKCQLSIGLIVGGEKTYSGEIPHMAALGYQTLDQQLLFGCGGSLISEMFVLTAAHCSSIGRTPPSVVRLGDQNRKVKEWNSTEIDVEIDEFIPHGNYSWNTRQHDIALVKMQHAVKVSMHIRPACLWQSFDISASVALASGWGYTRHSDSSSLSDELMKVKLDILDNRQCVDEYSDHSFVINQNQVCAGVNGGGADTCVGDSGGPLQIILPENQCMYSIIAITSYGNKRCGGVNSPSVYTRVSAYLNWIEPIVWK